MSSGQGNSEGAIGSGELLKMPTQDSAKPRGDCAASACIMLSQTERSKTSRFKKAFFCVVFDGYIFFVPFFFGFDWHVCHLLQSAKLENIHFLVSVFWDCTKKIIFVVKNLRQTLLLALNCSFWTIRSIFYTVRYCIK